MLAKAIELVLAGGTFFPPDAMLPVAAAPPEVGDDGLSARQAEIMRLVAMGKANKQICAELGVSENTIKVHLTAIFKKLKVRNRTEAALKITSSR